ncbi:hypothetical protein Tco_0073872 [Tanacetum coccineum]
MHDVLNTSVLKPMYKEFNALNKLETQRDILVVNAKNLQTKVDRTLDDLYKLVRLVPRIMNLMDTSTPSTNATTKGEKETDKGKGIAQTSDDDELKKIMPYMEEGGSVPNLSSLKHFRTTKKGPMILEEVKLQLPEVKRLANLKAKREKLEKKLKRLASEQLRAQEQELTEIETQRAQHLNRMRDEYMNCINFRDDPLPITKFNYRVNKASNIATIRITIELQNI